MKLAGKAHVFGDNISTDLIAPGRLSHLRSNLPEFAKHVLEDADSEFPKKVKKGDFVVGGSNFGLGSSREHAPTIIKLAGVSAVIAKSFARIFYRNCINVGLPAIVLDTSEISAGDELELDLDAGKLADKSKGKTYSFPALPAVMQNILADGGLVEHILAHGDFKIK
ncbi:MAG: 3-isopropylmalate dehydratase small subunit [Candidatus Altiarchaeota archaeon]